MMPVKGLLTYWLKLKAYGLALHGCTTPLSVEKQFVTSELKFYWNVTCSNFSDKWDDAAIKGDKLLAYKHTLLADEADVMWSERSE